MPILDHTGLSFKILLKFKIQIKKNKEPIKLNSSEITLFQILQQFTSYISLGNAFEYQSTIFIDIYLKFDNY
jgi:hypothetical protein